MAARHHGPAGQIDKLAGLEFFANGKKLAWLRDPVDVYALLTSTFPPA